MTFGFSLFAIKKWKFFKFLPWLGMLPFVAIPLTLVFHGQVAKGFAGLAFFGSCFGGVLIGELFRKFLNERLLRRPLEIVERFSASLAVFGFLFYPVLVADWANSRWNVGIEIQPVLMHFGWACIVAVIVFVISPVSTDK